MTMEERERLTRKRWMVLVSSCVINLCIGALYAWSVFAGPMAGYLSEITNASVTSADLAIVFSIGNSTGFITMIGGGYLNQKFGPRWVVMAGGILFGLGFVICGFARSVGGLILGYGIISGLSMGMAYGCTISNSVQFFPDRAGLVGGIATASYGISSVLIPPIANSLIDSAGVSKAFLYLGCFIIVIVAVFSQFIIKCPEGFAPLGWTPKEYRDNRKKETVPDQNWKQMMSSPFFYIMLIMLFFGAVLGMMIISQASDLAQELAGMNAGSAALVVSVLALFNTFGRILAGFISDRIGCIQTITGVFAAAVFAMVLLYLNPGEMVFCVGIFLTGACFGAFMGTYPSFTASQFGRKYSSVNYGIMFIGFNAAGLFGPMIVSGLYQTAKSYVPAFFTAMFFAVIGLLLSGVFQLAVRRSRLNKS